MSRNGIGTSKHVESPMASQIEDEPEARADFLKRLARLRKGNSIRVKSFSERYRS